MDNTNILKNLNRKCPFCAEYIKAEAIKCKYCGTDLASLSESEIQKLVSTREKEFEEEEKSVKLFGVSIIPAFIFSFIVYYIIEGMKDFYKIERLLNYGKLDLIKSNHFYSSWLFWILFIISLFMCYPLIKWMNEKYNFIDKI